MLKKTKITKKTILITGASQGIGETSAIKFLNEGYNVGLIARNKKKLESKFKNFKNALILPCDVSNYDLVKKSFKIIIKKWGRLDVLFNNAGIGVRANTPDKISYEDWKKVIDINLNSCFNLTKCAIREFMKKKDGVIINISSIVGVKGNAGQSNYSASKAGINGFTKSIALELGSRNIRCNAIAPGFIETDMTNKGDGKLLENWIESIPLKRAGNVSDVANLCSYLASDKASYITGQIIKVDGGLVT